MVGAGSVVGARTAVGPKTDRPLLGLSFELLDFAVNQVYEFV